MSYTKTLKPRIGQVVTFRTKEGGKWRLKAGRVEKVSLGNCEVRISRETAESTEEYFVLIENVIEITEAQANLKGIK